MSRYYADYVPPSSNRSYDERAGKARSPISRREYERDYRTHERRSRSPVRRYSYERDDRRRYESEHYHHHHHHSSDDYAYRYRRETGYDDRDHYPPPPPPKSRSRDREETKKSEYEIEYDPKTRTFIGASVKGKGPQPAYTSAKSMSIPKPSASSDDISSSSKRRKSRKGPIANYMDPDIFPNEKVICPYNFAHIVQRKRLQGHLLYCRKKFPNPDLKICPLNVLHVVKEADLESHILSCPDREIVRYLTFEPDFNKESPPHQGLIESTENWDDDIFIDYDPTIQIEKFKKKAEEADKEGYIPPAELPPVAEILNATSPDSTNKISEKQVEINGEIVKIKVEKPDIEEVNEHETMELLDEQMKDPEPEPEIVSSVREPRIRVKREWSPILAPRTRSPSLRRRSPVSSRRLSPPPLRRRSPTPTRRRRSPSIYRRRSPSLCRRRSPSLRRRSRSPRRRSPIPRYPSPRRIKREREDDGFDRFDSSRRLDRYERSPPPYYRVKEEHNGSSSSRYEPYPRYADDHSRKIKYEYDDYYGRKSPVPVSVPIYYDRKPSSKDLYSKYDNDEYDRRPRYEERRRSPSPRAYPSSYRPRSRSLVRYDPHPPLPTSRSPRSRSRYEKERSPHRFERELSRGRYDDRRKTPPPPIKPSKSYYDYPTYGALIEREKDFRKNPEHRIKSERNYSPPPSDHLRKEKEDMKNPLI